MSPITLELAPLNKADFARFGDVIEREGARHFPINRETVERYHDLAAVDVSADAGRTLISLVTCNVVAQLPYTLPFVERHPLGSQAFIPMDETPMVVAVAEAGDAPQPESIRAFISNGQQGVNYHRGVWHMPMVFLNQHQRMLVIDRGGEGHNCDELHFLDQEIIICSRSP